jgi:hypothetical protein
VLESWLALGGSSVIYVTLDGASMLKIKFTFLF